MKTSDIKNIKYLISSRHDKDWGITVNTVGCETIEKNYEKYPPRKEHPVQFFFTPSKGRKLESYQLLYIVKGKGTFFTSPEESMEIKEGDMIILRPQQWHSYMPDKKTGWKEMWIGFEGTNMDSRFKNNFFNKKQTIYRIGVQDNIVSLYDQAIKVANEEKAGCQQFLAGIANLILGMTMYYDYNRCFDTAKKEQIDKAKIIIRENLLKEITPEDVASRINMSYSWFRKLFKEYTGVSPAHYIQELKIKEAKHILSESDINIKEVSFYLGFDDIAYFSKVFKKYTGLTPIEYKKIYY
ncbi:helix-turn-helix transcriptional regulator [Bacteroides caecigallinarum]|uniref:AraC family transcriptional regulator n=1 Tax=Bacteroides caecigallinarum TaxID=1411144 RepID=UPI0019586F7C|nr:AraC family transcriptional regulator [Bacteroides caecigallinarum]MBM6864677.1 helix-turn-helix transcriptional regulator [Bacteroides caecigallinarum]